VRYSTHTKGDVMHRSLFAAALLTAGLFTAPGYAPAAASEASDTPNIGFVLYTRSPAPGTLNARWMYGGKYSGPGIATGGPKEGFAGKYHVRYFYDSGKFSDEYDLVIEKKRGRVQGILDHRRQGQRGRNRHGSRERPGCRLAQGSGLTVATLRTRIAATACAGMMRGADACGLIRVQISAHTQLFPLSRGKDRHAQFR